MGRVSRAQAAMHRDQILRIAARRFCQSGVAGVGVAEVMAEAGLTHGGFYGHFPSKDDLAAAACAQAFAGTAQKWTDAADAGAIIAGYLSPAHRDNAGQGCAIPALAEDVAHDRPGGALRQAFTQGVRQVVDVLASRLPGAPARRHDRALATLAAMVGAIAIARAMPEDPLADELLSAVRRHLLGASAAPVTKLIHPES